MKKDKAREQTITGIIVPAEWDDDDNVIGVAIETEDYEEYFVDQNEKGRELLAFIDYEVEVTGTVTRRRDGDMTINVRSYESLGEYEGEEYVEQEYGKIEEDDEW